MVAFPSTLIYTGDIEKIKGLMKSKRRITILHLYIKDKIYSFAHLIPQSKHSR